MTRLVHTNIVQNTIITGTNYHQAVVLENNCTHLEN